MKVEPLHDKVMDQGVLLKQPKSAASAAEYARKQLDRLPNEHKRFENPHIYKVGVSPRLYNTQQNLLSTT
ncbi:MAG: hypothetical protein U5K69_12615 [Balneolaceae bacterium]|nr:hypothetical protein [Balneolaceae bacterium]